MTSAKSRNMGVVNQIVHCVEPLSLFDSQMGVPTQNSYAGALMHQVIYNNPDQWAKFMPSLIGLSASCNSLDCDFFHDAVVMFIGKYGKSNKA